MGTWIALAFLSIKSGCCLFHSFLRLFFCFRPSFVPRLPPARVDCFSLSSSTSTFSAPWMLFCPDAVPVSPSVALLLVLEAFFFLVASRSPLPLSCFLVGSSSAFGKPGRSLSFSGPSVPSRPTSIAARGTLSNSSGWSFGVSTSGSEPNHSFRRSLCGVWIS